MRWRSVDDARFTLRARARASRALEASRLTAGGGDMDDGGRAGSFYFLGQRKKEKK